MQPVCSVRCIQPSALCNGAGRSAKQPAATLWQMKSEYIERGGRDRGRGVECEAEIKNEGKVHYSSRRRREKEGKRSGEQVKTDCYEHVVTNGGSRDSAFLPSAICAFLFFENPFHKQGTAKSKLAAYTPKKGKLLTWFEPEKASRCYLLVLQVFNHFSARARLPTRRTSSPHLCFAVLPSLHPVLSPAQDDL